MYEPCMSHLGHVWATCEACMSLFGQVWATWITYEPCMSLLDHVWALYDPCKSLLGHVWTMFGPNLSSKSKFLFNGTSKSTNFSLSPTCTTFYFSILIPGTHTSCPCPEPPPPPPPFLHFIFLANWLNYQLNFRTEERKVKLVIGLK